MQTFDGRTAVVTGAASGIGRALAERFCRLGMHVVLADVEAPALARTTSELGDAGAPVLPVVTDVAAKVEDGIRANRLHILTDDAFVPNVEARPRAIVTRDASHFASSPGDAS